MAFVIDLKFKVKFHLTLGICGNFNAKRWPEGQQWLLHHNAFVNASCSQCSGPVSELFLQTSNGELLFAACAVLHRSAKAGFLILRHSKLAQQADRTSIKYTNKNIYTVYCRESNAYMATIQTCIGSFSLAY